MDTSLPFRRPPSSYLEQQADYLTWPTRDNVIVIIINISFQYTDKYFADNNQYANNIDGRQYLIDEPPENDAKRSRDERKAERGKWANSGAT